MHATYHILSRLACSFREAISRSSQKSIRPPGQVTTQKFKGQVHKLSLNFVGRTVPGLRSILPVAFKILVDNEVT